MSATEATWRPRDLINCDRVLLAVLSALLLSHAGLYYVSLRFNLPFAFVLAWSTSSFVLDLRLPESIASAVIENFFMLVVGEFYAFILTIRFIELRTWKSPSLLSCAALLVAYHFGGTSSLDYCFDQIRFQLNWPAYLAMARNSEGWPDLRCFVGERAVSLIYRFSTCWCLIELLLDERRLSARSLGVEKQSHEVRRFSAQAVGRLLFSNGMVRIRNLIWRKNFESLHSGLPKNLPGSTGF